MTLVLARMHEAIINIIIIPVCSDSYSKNDK